MGLVSGDVDGKHIFKTLTDILGAEDAFGDMDFKVAGTSEFITALQLDTKLDGIPADILAAALQQAKEARATILEVINECIDGPAEMSELLRASSPPPFRSRRSARSSAEGQDDQPDSGRYRR